MGIKNNGNKDSAADTDGLMDLIIKIRSDAKLKKDFNTADKIRDGLGEIGITINDTKEGATWDKK